MKFIVGFLYFSLLMLSAIIFTGGELISKAEAGAGGVPLRVSVERGTDDAEENTSTGYMSLDSSDLELIQDGSKHQKVGIRFPLNLPERTIILDAFIQFTTDVISVDSSELLVAGQKILDAPTFSDASFDISNRTLTTANVPWIAQPWHLKGEAGPNQQTPDLSTIVQEVLDQSGWVQGNYIAFVISGNGKREAESFDGTAAPVLHVKYSIDPPDPVVPIAIDDDSFALPAYTTAQDQPLTVLNGANDIVERNDNVGFPVAAVTTFGPHLGTETNVAASGVTLNEGAVVVEADGSLTYTPPALFLGVDEFVYTLANSAGSDKSIVYINVEEVQEVETIWVSVAVKSDDAEQEISNGNVSLNSSDLEMAVDGSAEQLVGVRFQNVMIPQGATIVDSYIQYTSDEVDSESTNLTIAGQNSTNPATFTTINSDISNRPLTAAQVPWKPAPWTTNEQSSEIQATPNLAAIVEEIVGQAGWVSGNPMVFITSGTGKRVAESYNGTAAPMLHVTYSIAPVVSVPPVAVDDTYTTRMNVPVAGELLGNDDLGFPLATVSVFEFSSVQGGTVSVSGDGSFTFTPAAGFLGPDSFTYTLSNGEIPDSIATVSIEVESFSVEGVIRVPVIMRSDDAEEDISNGSVDITSSDLEMVLDKSKVQIVGVRFQNIEVPDGARITEAYIQYQVDERTSEHTQLVVHGELSPDAATFDSTNGNISTRTLTAVSVLWSPPRWNTKGAADSDQQTPDLSEVVQEIIDQASWISGNSIAFITSGAGNRVAASFNGDTAPELHLVYSIESADNLLPGANSALIQDADGGDLVVGDTLEGLYDYADAESNAEEGSIYAWYRDGVLIPGADTTTYVTGSADGGKNITFKVIPVAIGGSSPGDEVTSLGVDVLFEVGGTGPAGGTVFYVNGGGTLGKGGMEVAPAVLGSALWGCYAATLPPAVETGAVGHAIGTGEQNTADILTACTETGIAAELADQYILNGFDDWILPSAQEGLLLLGLGGVNSYFWTSTEMNAFSAYFVRNSEGDISSGKKGLLLNVLPIRTFGALVANVAPEAQNIEIDGLSYTSSRELFAKFDYFDAEGDAAGNALFQWFRDGVALAGETSGTYISVSADIGAKITVEVRAVALTGSLVGEPFLSDPSCIQYCNDCEDTGNL